MCGRIDHVDGTEIVSTDDHEPPSGRRAVRIAIDGAVPFCQTAVAVPLEATNRSGLWPSPSGIAWAAVHGWPGALSANITMSASSHTAVIRPCGSTPIAPVPDSPAPDSCSDGAQAVPGPRVEPRMLDCGVPSPANSDQITAAVPGELVASRAASLNVPGLESVSGRSHVSAPCAVAGSAANAPRASRVAIPRDMRSDRNAPRTAGARSRSRV